MSNTFSYLCTQCLKLLAIVAHVLQLHLRKESCWLGTCEHHLLPSEAVLS